MKNIEIQRPTMNEINETFNKIKYKLRGPFIFFIYVNIFLYFLYFVDKIFWKYFV